MSGYAPNPSSPSDNGYAELTAGLLARKGEALPAVDADAHAGIDIAMRPVRPANSKGGPRNISQETIESLYPANTGAGAAVKNRITSEAHSANANSPRKTAAPAPAMPDAWTIIEPKKAAPRAGLRQRRPSLAEAGGRKATVTFKMPAHDFIRLRFGARDLETTCQTIILEALECFLDANDVEEISDEACARETARLMRVMRKRRG